MPTSLRRHYWLAVALAASAPAVAQLSQPGVAPARGPDAPKSTPTPTPDPTATPEVDPQGNAPIVPQAEFDKAMPPLSNDMNAPLEQMTPTPAPAATSGTPLPQAPTGAPIKVGDTLAPVSPEDPALAQPLAPISSFDTTPLETAADIKDAKAPTIRYTTEVTGLDKLDLTGQFKSLSALQSGHGKAANATMVAARAREDEALAVRLMKSIGYYDATAISSVQTVPNSGELKVVLTASAGRLYHLSSVTIDAPPVVPPDLISHNLPIKVGDPIEAARIEGAEANVSLVLPQEGYPFVKVGQRDILLDDQSPLAVNLLGAGVAAALVALAIHFDGPASVAQWAAVGVGGYAVFSWGSALRTRDPATFALTLGSRAFMAVVIAYAMTALVAYGVAAFAASFVREGFGVPADVAGLWIGGPAALSGFLGITIGGRVADRLRERYARGRLVVILFGGVAPVVPIVLAFTATSPGFFYVMLPVTQLLASTALGASAAATQDLVLPTMRGTATAVFLIGTTLLGLALGPYLAGRISVATGSLSTGVLSLLVALPIGLAAGLAAWRWVPEAEARRTAIADAA